MAIEWGRIRDKLERLDEPQKTFVADLVDFLSSKKVCGIGIAELQLQQQAAAKVWENDPVTYDDV